MNKLLLTVEKIVEYEFKTDFKGYSPLEVDKILDAVIHDYTVYESTLDQFEQRHLQDLTTIENLMRENQELKARLSINDENSPSHSYVDLIRRVARLEEVVFQKR